MATNGEVPHSTRLVQMDDNLSIPPSIQPAQEDENLSISDTNKGNSMKEEHNVELCPFKIYHTLWKNKIQTEYEKKNEKKIFNISNTTGIVNEMHTSIENTTDDELPHTNTNDEKINENIRNASKIKKNYNQIPRKFKGNPDDSNYYQGYIFTQPESGGTLSNRCLEFKSFFNCVNNKKDLVHVKFLKETLRFACACINKRVNGTIYFGVADSRVQKNEFENFFHGEIVGFQIDERDLNCKYQYTDALRKNIKKCFDVYSASDAECCISDPRFILVDVPGGETNYYVMEVDIEPASMFCKGRCFYLDMKIIENPKIKRKDREWKVYERKNSSTESIKKDMVENFINIDIPRLDQQRKEFENQKILEQLSDLFKENF